MVKSDLKTGQGSPYYEGATLNIEGCNFTVFSKNATDVYLLLFDNCEDAEPRRIIKFDPKINKTGDMWHIFVYGVKQGQFYGYCVDGPYWPEKKGHRFNVNKLLIDPYAKAVTGEYKWVDLSSFGYDYYSPYKDLSFDKQKNWGNVPKSVVVDTENFDWEGDKPLNIPLNETIIYEMHVRGFTNDESSGVKNPGTYLGVIEKIPYLKELGITTIELLPVHEFNEFENTRINPMTKERLVNFTGYSTLAFFAPDVWYATKRDGLTAVSEFKTMVKELHKAGIEVILDVVYNHTGEGNESGPTISFKGFDNSIYYMLEKGRYYKNYSGCGNTLNCNHPVVKHLIKDSLRYWVVDMHIDGFRFDLAAIMGRDRNGKWIPDYSVLTEISEDPILSNTKIIAESWDAAGLYTVGGFPSGWAEWNGKYRDDVR
nr:alpha-amylase family glycosyl hydrolase [Spirochaetota bacterium]